MVVRSSRGRFALRSSAPDAAAEDLGGVPVVVVSVRGWMREGDGGGGAAALPLLLDAFDAPAPAAAVDVALVFAPPTGCAHDRGNAV